MPDFSTRSKLLNYMSDKFFPIFEKEISVGFMYGVWCRILSRNNQWTSGTTTCPVCWDPYGQVPTDPECPVCHGSGYIGSTGEGYSDSKFYRMHAPEFPIEHNRTKRGYVHQVPITLWIEYKERKLDKGDVIIWGDVDNEDYPTKFTKIRERFVVDDPTHVFLTPTGEILSQQVKVETIDEESAAEEILETGGDDPY